MVCDVTATFSMNRLFLSLVTLSPLASWAFSNTAPVIAWSDSALGSNIINRLPLNTDIHTNLFESILSNDDICAPQALVLVHQPGVRIYIVYSSLH